MQLLSLLLALLGPAASFDRAQDDTVVAQSLFGGLPIDGIHCDRGLVIASSSTNDIS